MTTLSNIQELADVVSEDNVDKFKKVLSKYKNVKAGDIIDDSGNSMLHVAAFYNSRNVAEFLVNQHVDVNLQNNEGVTPLFATALKNSVDVAKILLSDNNTNVNVPCKEGVAPLQVAVFQNNQSIAKLLLEKDNIDVNKSNDNGCTPLHFAASKTDSEEIINILIKKGANVNAKADNNTTPLHVAAKYSTTAIIQILINGGADVNAKGSQGLVPLHIASLAGKCGVAELLLTADTINAVDNTRRTPLDYAKLGNRSNTLKDLLDSVVNKCLT